MKTFSSLVALALLSSWLAGPVQADCGRCRHVRHWPAIVLVEPVGPPVYVVAFDGHRFKKAKDRVKAFRAKHLPKPPDVKPEPVKPVVKPKVKGDHGFGRFHPLQRFRDRFRPSDGPDYTPGPSRPTDHPSLKPVPSEKLPLPKPSKVPGVQDKPTKPKS